MKLNLTEILSFIPSGDKDVKRIGLFLAAVAEKVTELMVTNPEKVQPFIQESSVLVSKWLDKSKKLQFPIDFFRDPFKQLRQETRDFAAKWELNFVFRNLMG